MKIKAHLESTHEWNSFSDRYESSSLYQAKNKTVKPQRKDDSKSKERKVDYNKQRELKRST
jgi:hypothetical protein